MHLKVQKTVSHAKLPELGSAGAGAVDLFASETIVLEPLSYVQASILAACYDGGTPPDFKKNMDANGIPDYAKHPLVPTGIKMEIPKGFVGLIRDRSSWGVRQLHIGAGVIDSDYRGEIFVCLYHFHSHPIVVKQGDKIAQMVIVQHLLIESIGEHDDLSQTERGEKGFGQASGQGQVGQDAKPVLEPSKGDKYTEGKRAIFEQIYGCKPEDYKSGPITNPEHPDFGKDFI